MTQSISTNTFGVAKWVVSADPTQGTHTTIATALASASSGDVIWIRQGIYTENVTLPAGIILRGCSQQNVVISGTVTMTAPGSSAIEDITLITNSTTPVISITGSNAVVLYLSYCYILASTNAGIVINNSSAQVICNDCLGAATFNLFAVTAATTLAFYQCQMTLAGAHTTANTLSGAATLQISNSEINSPITTSGTASGYIHNSSIDVGLANVIALTHGGTGNAFQSINTFYNSDTASAISVGAGASLNSYNDTIGSSNTNAVTGAGTVNIFDPTYSNTSHLVNTTTATGGVYSANIGAALPATGCIGEVIAGSVSGVTPLVSGTNIQLSTITLTPGSWNVFGSVSVQATGTNTTDVEVQGFLSPTTASASPINFMGQVANGGVGFLNFTNANWQGVMGPCVVHISANTNYFCNILASAAVTFNMEAEGFLFGERIG